MFVNYLAILEYNEFYKVESSDTFSFTIQW